MKFSTLSRTRQVLAILFATVPWTLIATCMAFVPLPEQAPDPNPPVFEMAPPLGIDSTSEEPAAGSSGAATEERTEPAIFEGASQDELVPEDGEKETDLDGASRQFPTGRLVEDQASLLDAVVAGHLDSLLSSFEARRSGQVGVLTIGSLQGRPIEEVSIEAATQWKLGRKGKDDGVMLLIARDDRKLRIEVGYGLEHILTDAACQGIIRNEIVPLLKAGDPDNAVVAGVEAILRTLDPEFPIHSFVWSPPPGEQRANQARIAETQAAEPEERKVTHPVAALMLLLAMGCLIFFGYMVLVRERMIYLLLVPVYPVACFFLYDKTLGVGIGMILFWGLVGLTLIFHGESSEDDDSSGQRGWSGGSSSSSSSSTGGGGSSRGGTFGGGGASGGW